MTPLPAGYALRPFRDADYPGLAALQLAIYADFATPEDEQRRDDALKPAFVRRARFVVEDAATGQVIATAEYSQEAGRYEPGRFGVFVDVLPGHEGRGIGGAAWDHLMAELARHEPAVLETYVREENARGLDFAGRRGLLEARRVFPSDADLASFDLSPWAGLEDRLREKHGVVIRTVGDLEGDPERGPKLHALCEAIRADFPSDAPATAQSYDAWVERFWDEPLLVKDAYHVAVAPDGVTYIGYNNLGRDEEEPGRLWTKQTGLLREWRQKGIATALKVRGMAWAKEHGYKTVRTFNDSANAPMLAVNERLGFRRLPAWIYLKKVLKEEESPS